MQKPQQAALFHQKYTIQNQIGRGASGICYKIRNTIDGKTYALKKISQHSIKKNNLRQASHQVTLLSSIQHPNIIKYYESFIDDNNLFIIMQYASKGDLHAILKKRKIKNQFYNEAQIWTMCRELVDALDYLHHKNIIHRDIKTLNIFAGDQNQLIIGDLGVSKIIKTDLGLYSRVGTPLYLSPQIIKYEKYDFKADIWGLGCVAYLLTTLNHPFEGKNIISLGQNIVNSDPKPIQNYSPKLKEFIFDMLDKNHLKRPSAQSLKKKYFQTNITKQLKQIKPEISINNFMSVKNQEQEKNLSTKQLSKKIGVNQNLKNQLMKKIDSKLTFQKSMNYKNIAQKRKQVYIINNVIQEKMINQDNSNIMIIEEPFNVASIPQKNVETIPDTTSNNMNFQTTILRKPSQKTNQFQLKNEQLTEYKNSVGPYENQKRPIITASVNYERPVKSQIKSWISSNQIKKKTIHEKQEIFFQQKQFNSNQINPANNLNNQIKKKWIKKVSYSAKCFQPSAEFESKKTLQSNQPNINNNAFSLKKISTQSKFNQIPLEIMNKADSQCLFVSNQKKGRIFRSTQRSNSQAHQSKQMMNLGSIYCKVKEPADIYSAYTHSSPCNQIVQGIQRKFRQRPKSSIGKGKHQTTMKQLRPYRKKCQIEQIQAMIETKILKKPERIVI